MTKKELINLKDGTPIYIHMTGFSAKLTTFDKKRLIVSQGQQGYLDGSMFVRVRYMRLATKQDIEDKKETASYAISPIIVSGDAIGAVIIFSLDNNLGEFEEKTVSIAAKFLGKYIEE